MEPLLCTRYWEGAGDTTVSRRSKDPAPHPPRTDMQKGGHRETRHEQQTQGNCLVQSVLPNATCVFLKINMLYKNRALKTKGPMEGKDRNLVKTVAQFYAWWMVKKFINATVNMALDEEKTWRKWASEGLQLVSRCGAGRFLEIREKVVTPPADRACLIKKDVNEAESRCVRCEHVCVLCIPMGWAQLDVIFLCSPTAFAKKITHEQT